MSDKPLAQKLQVKEGRKLLLINAPKGYKESLGGLPSGEAVLTKSTDLVDIVQIFATTQKELEQLGQVKKLLKPNGILWVTYPKGTSKNFKADINRDSIAAYARKVGLQAVAMVAVDEDWSALRLKMV